MAEITAANGSRNVTIKSNTDSGKGQYAADGSRRVTIK